MAGFPWSCRCVSGWLRVEVDLGEGGDPRWRYGSGLVIGDRTVLTAAHVVLGAAAVTVGGPDKRPRTAALDRAWIGDPDRFDLALLGVCDLPDALPPLPVVVVDRDVTSGEYVEAWSVYPLFQEIERDGAGRSVRETAEVRGSIPPLSGLVARLLSLQVTQKPRDRLRKRRRWGVAVVGNVGQRIISVVGRRGVGKSGVVTKVVLTSARCCTSSLGAFRSRSRTRKALPPTRTRRARTWSSTCGTRADSRCFGWAGWRKPSPTSPPRRQRRPRLVRTGSRGSSARNLAWASLHLGDWDAAAAARQAANRLTSSSTADAAAPLALTESLEASADQTSSNSCGGPRREPTQIPTSTDRRRAR